MLKRLGTTLVFLFIFVGCGGTEPEATPTAETTGMGFATQAPEEVDSVVETEPTATAIPDSEAEPTEIPSVPTQPPPTTAAVSDPLITVLEQTLGESGDIVIASVRVVKDGWLILLADSDGTAGEILRAMPLPAGEYTNLDLGCLLYTSDAADD